LDLYFVEPEYSRLVEVVAVSDLVREREEAAAARFFGARRRTLEELLADDDVEVVVNLTQAPAHAEVTLAALDAGKAVYTEKPLAWTLEEAEIILEIPGATKRVACAPDTFLGASAQVARRAIDAGAIGEPALAVASFFGTGDASRFTEPSWPGILPDVGVYYVTWLAFLLGAAVTVQGMSSVLLGARPAEGRRRGVTRGVSSHTIAAIEYADEALAVLTIGFGLGGSASPEIEVHGRDGVLSLPNPAFFNGAVRIRSGDGDEWSELRLPDAYPRGRGAGVVDLAVALRSDRPPRCGLELAFHVLEIMKAATSGCNSETRLSSWSSRPEPLILSDC
jgi:predicted dehydrogenase